jgi:microcystin-dependent protein
LLTNAVTAVEIAANAVGASELADNAVDTAAIVNNAVTRAKVTPGGFNPVGTVIWYAGSSAPAGYLKCNGDTLPNDSTTAVQGITADWTTLYAIVGANLPDLRGEFIRGWDDSKGTDSGRGIRTSQSDQNKQHNHTGSASTASTSLTGTIAGISESFNSGGSASGVFTKSTGSNTGNTPSGHSDSGNCGSVAFDGSHSHTTTVTIANTGGTETRPRNIALLACIKY